MLFFQCLFIVSRRWLTVDFEQCHHRDAASSISTFLTLAVTDLSTAKTILPTRANTFSFLLWSSAWLFYIIAGDFLFARLAEGIHNTRRIYCFASRARSISHSLLYRLPHLYTTFPYLDAFWLIKSSYPKLSSLFSELLSSLPISLSPYT